MPVESAIAAVMPTTSSRSSATVTSSSANTAVHLVDGVTVARPVSGSNADEGLCIRSTSSFSAGS